MPFIRKEDRPKFDAVLTKLPDFDNKGELEYCVYLLLAHYMKTRLRNYDNLHSAVYGGLHASEEFKRRTLDKREDEASEKNGDIPLIFKEL